MANSAANSRLLAIALAAVVVIASLHSLSTAFLPVAAPVQAATLAAAALGAAAPAFAEEAAAGAPAAVEKVVQEVEKVVQEPQGFLNLGKIELGGGFAINLDIPETGIVNIAVLIGGLLYLLGPLLTNSMETRQKEITQDIADAIAKYNEATSRLAEAEKAKSQADEVIAEIEGSISKDQAQYKTMVEESVAKKIAMQAGSATALTNQLEQAAIAKLENYVTSESVQRGLKEMKILNQKQKDSFMDKAIASL